MSKQLPSWFSVIAIIALLGLLILAFAPLGEWAFKIWIEQK